MFKYFDLSIEVGPQKQITWKTIITFVSNMLASYINIFFILSRIVLLNNFVLHFIPISSLFSRRYVSKCRMRLQRNFLCMVLRGIIISLEFVCHRRVKQILYKIFGFKTFHGLILPFNSHQRIIQGVDKKQRGEIFLDLDMVCSCP